MTWPTKLAIALCAALSLPPIPSATAAPEAGPPRAQASALVDQVLQAYGGAKKISKLERTHFEGQTTAHIRGGKASFRRDFAAPSSLRVDLVYADRGEVRILSGGKGWRGDAAAQAEVSGMPRTAMVFQMLRSAAPWVVREHRDELELSASEPGYHVLRLRSADGLTADFWVDDATHLITKVVGTLTAGPMTMTFATEYADFKKVQGISIPHTEQSYVNGQHTATSVLTRVVLGAKKLGPFAPATP